METRICGLCREEKPIEEYYRNKSRPSGRGFWCKECCKGYERLPHRKGRHAKWRGSSKGIERTRQYNQEHYAEEKPKNQTRSATKRLVKLGVIKKMPCGICGDGNSQAHHPDYTQPLEVVWLCQSHHYDVDRR
ncbi:hypothetical protein LCGC14_1795370 [marine sediment metagenome]|uniref:Uncharacterized protein n=1 Tax=marine sediment metagenome TaxID=412755 RepID=A0A0F9GR74_9ZZZZ